MNLVNRVMETSSNDHVVNDSERSRDSCGQCQESSSAMLVRRILSNLIGTNKMDVIYYFDQSQPQKPHEILVKDQLNRIKKNIRFAKNFQLTKNLNPSLASQPTSQNSNEITVTPVPIVPMESEISKDSANHSNDNESLEILISSLDDMDILDLLLLMYHDIDHELTNQIIQQKLRRRLNETNQDSGNDLTKLELESESSATSISNSNSRLVQSEASPKSLAEQNVDVVTENGIKVLETKKHELHSGPTQDDHAGFVPSSDQSVNQYWGSTADWSTTRPPTITSKPLESIYSRESTKLQDDKSE